MVYVVIAAISLAILHVAGGRLRFITYLPRSRWLSFAGGVSVAYVFLHLLPEIAEAEEALEGAGEAIGLEGQVPYLIALIGMALFYGVEIQARKARKDQAGNGRSVFWFSIGTYSAYNGLVGYLLHERIEEGLTTLVVFTVAMGLHFLMNDFALREHHRDLYSSVGRWLLVGAIFAGAVMGWVAELSDAARGSVVAFVGGGVILNVLKEEIPEDRESSFTSFALGAGLYGLLLLAL